MSMATPSHVTRCRLPGIDLVSFAEHACHDYNHPDQFVVS